MNEPTTGPSPSARANIITAFLAAIGASLCCVAPLVLLALGIGGTWISHLTALEPYRPVFIGITLVFLVLAFRKLYLVPQRCAPGDVCAVPAIQRRQRLLFWGVTVILLVLLTFPYYSQALFG